MAKNIIDIISMMHRIDKHMTLNESEKYTEDLMGKDVELIICYRGDDNWKKYVEPNYQFVWDFLVKAYDGDFRGCQSRNDLKKKCSLVKIALNNNSWIAISVYSSYLGGYKCVGIGGDKDSPLKNIGVQEIIKDDIKNYDKWFWCECSGVIEHYFEKNNGIKIEIAYVPQYLGNININPIDDYHYYRNISGQMFQKVIFGFNTQETFDKIYSEQKEYIDKCIENIRRFNIGEGVLKDQFESLGMWTVEVEIIEFFVKHYEKGYHELPEESIVHLEKSVTTLQNMFSNKEIPPTGFQREFMNALRTGTELLDKIQVLKLNKFC